MRRINVRREELYELVWSKPRTTVNVPSATAGCVASLLVVLHC